MNNSIIRYLVAVVYGVTIPAIPYGIFVYVIQSLGEERFNINPQFLAVILGIGLLIFGAYTSGKFLGKKGNIYSLIWIILSTPGLHIGVVGITVTVAVDGKVSEDGLTALMIMTLMLFVTSVPFSLLGYRKSTR